MKNTWEIFAANLTKIRKSRKLTQKKLAEISGLDKATVYRYETAKQPPRANNLKAIAKALNVTEAELLGSYVSEKQADLSDILRRLATLDQDQLGRLAEFLDDIAPETREIVRTKKSL